MAEHQFHFVAGLPRSGSTLLCDILNQRDDTFASSTSICDMEAIDLRNRWSTSPEVQSDLHHDKSAAERRMVRKLQGLLESAYAEEEKPIVFDKGRRWTNSIDSLRTTHPKSAVIITMRNPLDCYASVDKHHQRFPLLDIGGSADEPALAKVVRYFDPQKGMLGSNLIRIESIMARKNRPANIVLLSFEELVREPVKVLRRLYAEIDLPDHQHDFENVEATSVDLDVLHLYKFPHRRETGPIKPPKTDWREVIPEGLAAQIAKQYPATFQRMGYR